MSDCICISNCICLCICICIYLLVCLGKQEGVDVRLEGVACAREEVKHVRTVSLQK